MIRLILVPSCESQVEGPGTLTFWWKVASEQWKWRGHLTHFGLELSMASPDSV